MVHPWKNPTLKQHILRISTTPQIKKESITPHKMTDTDKVWSIWNRCIIAITIWGVASLDSSSLPLRQTSTTKYWAHPRRFHLASLFNKERHSITMIVIKNNKTNTHLIINHWTTVQIKKTIIIQLIKAKRIRIMIHMIWRTSKSQQTTFIKKLIINP